MRYTGKQDTFKRAKDLLDQYIKQDTKYFLYDSDKEIIHVLYHNSTWMRVKLKDLTKWMNDKNKKETKKGGE